MSVIIFISCSVRIWFKKKGFSAKFMLVGLFCWFDWCGIFPSWLFIDQIPCKWKPRFWGLGGQKRLFSEKVVPMGFAESKTMLQLMNFLQIRIQLFRQWSNPTLEQMNFSKFCICFYVQLENEFLYSRLLRISRSLKNSESAWLERKRCYTYLSLCFGQQAKATLYNDSALVDPMSN